ncbi:MAG TPA: SRPBCC family protein [Gemmatimonadaceae bacterium]|jgi:hypothetical protein|nr:SRPBCC family protein [Gemmatimonadaceae bacterium]
MRKIELPVEIHAPAEQVWRAISTPEEIARWFAPVVTGSATVGEQMTFSWYPGGEYSGTVDVRDEGRHLRWSDDAFVPRETALNQVRANAPDDFRVRTSEAPDRLWGTLPAYGDALVLIENEPGRESYHCGVYISLYGDATRHEATLRPWLARMLDQGLH